jgi:acetoin utilization deacetylase AcuC-like enzyme
LSSATSRATALVHGEQIARYGFGEGHPFGPDRHDAFMREFTGQGLLASVESLAPREATMEELHWFHTAPFIALVKERSASGSGYLDAGDTPAWQGVFEAASSVVGAALEAAEALMRGEARRAFVPIAGLHHASRSHAAGFCVFNDCGGSPTSTSTSTMATASTTPSRKTRSSSSPTCTRMGASCTPAPEPRGRTGSAPGGAAS